ncbi:hypothetical protein G9C98_000771 [Cotesia typhae]|uniref:Peptidase M12A domain-containing protein n=1 Tax=Cotesia typhae TaxID=2053667 RepID=A0A8J5V0I5_9HYME|nr:hypothetical protein G9C98_000771 [Cotesia typhae]
MIWKTSRVSSACPTWGTRCSELRVTEPAAESRNGTRNSESIQRNLENTLRATFSFLGRLLGEVDWQTAPPGGQAMDDFRKYTCIQFVPHNGERDDYIRITAGNTGCWSSVGRIGGRQDVNLQVPGCVVKKGTVIHELMHAVGFVHEQSRYDRDEFVEIQWQNIKPGNTINFLKVGKDTTDHFGVKYDFGSVMHYSKNAFSVNGQATIIPKETNGGFFGAFDDLFGGTKPSLGQREGFSKQDIRKIRKMYNCDGPRRRNARSRPQVSLFDFFW